MRLKAKTNMRMTYLTLLKALLRAINGLCEIRMTNLTLLKVSLHAFNGLCEIRLTNLTLMKALLHVINKKTYFSSFNSSVISFFQLYFPCSGFLPSSPLLQRSIYPRRSWQQFYQIGVFFVCQNSCTLLFSFIGEF